MGQINTNIVIIDNANEIPKLPRIFSTVCVVLSFSVIGILLLKEELFWGINKTCKYIAFFWIGYIMSMMLTFCIPWKIRWK